MEESLSNPSFVPLIDKIIPLSEASDDLILEKHAQELRECMQRVFGQVPQETPQETEERFPKLHWKLCSRSGVLLIYLLAREDEVEKPSLALKEKLDALIFPEKIKILSSKNFTFFLSEKNRRVYFEEILFSFPKGISLELIEKNVPLIEKELQSTHSISNSKPWLPSISGGEQNADIYKAMHRLIRRYPALFDEKIFREAQYFLLDCREEFLKLRTKRHLSRIITSHFLFLKALEQDIKAYPGKRHLYFKLLKGDLLFPFGKSQVLGIAIAHNMLQENECFEPCHILKAIQRIIPHSRTVPDSFYSDRTDAKKQVLYLEIEKTKGESFSLLEIKELKKNLREELKNSIAYLTPHSFFPEMRRSSFEISFS